MVSEKLQWEQEIANFYVEIDPTREYTDIQLVKLGHMLQVI